PAQERGERRERPRHEQRPHGERRPRRNGGSGPNHRTANGGVRKGEVGRHSGRVRRSSEARV
ncbi:hypothetical protein, partial [Sphingosinicella sp. YJ22]|uniref:hypothetical protein n=1 Tax=Sphingosinicella sp. YJ22 TaxID=1104780 RepID=UPI001A9CAD4A